MLNLLLDLIFFIANCRTIYNQLSTRDQIGDLIGGILICRLSGKRINPN
jgi:hypothetical protein